MRTSARGRRSHAAGASERPPGHGGRPRRSTAFVAAAWISSVVVVVLIAGALVGYAKYRQIWDGIRRDAVTNLGQRPPKYNNALNLLVFGSDSRAGLTPHEQFVLHVGSQGCGCSDTIMVVHISPGRHQATVLNLPRDTMVPQYGCAAGPGLAGQVNDPLAVVQINETLSHGGPSCLWKTVEHITGIHLDHFIQLEFTGVVKVVNDVGGVNVCVPQTIHDSRSGLNITAGEHHIDGLTFLEFWRARYAVADGTDLKRIGRDDLLLAEMLRGILHSGLLSSPTKLLPVVDDAAHAIYATDRGLTQTDLLQIATSFRHLTSNDVQFIEAPTQVYPPAPAQVEFVQPADQKLFSAIAHDTTLPKKAKAKGAGSARPGRTVVETVAPADVKAEVLNGTTESGLAGTTAANLTARGFHVLGTGDAASPSYTGSVIEYPSAAELPQARTMAAQVPGATLHADPAVTAGTVELILGSSFTGLATTPTPAASATPAATPSVGSLAQNFGGITGNATCRTDAGAFAP
jgi:LCP family protein required for cell wall assembly